jgi:hypothetical protein
VEQSGRRGDGGRSAGVERAARSNAFDNHNEPCSARWRAMSARAARVRPRRTVSAQDPAWLRGPLTRDSQRCTCELALLERAEVRVATKPRATSATAASWAAPRSDAHSRRRFSGMSDALIGTWRTAGTDLLRHLLRTCHSFAELGSHRASRVAYFVGCVISCRCDPSPCFPRGNYYKVVGL